MEIQPRSSTDTAPVRRRIKRIDGRHRAARRVKELSAAFAARLGNPTDPARLSAIVRAAELTTVAEGLRARVLAGEAIDLGELVKLEGAAHRAVRALGIDRRRDPPRKSLREMLEAEAAEADNDEAEQA